MTSETIKKVYALALQGVGGEKQAAIEMLDKLVKKYNISLDELNEEEIKKFRLKYHGKEEELLLHQIAYKITNKTDIFYYVKYVKSGRKCKTEVGIECTEAQKNEIEFLFDFYKQLWKKEKENFLSAFIQKHRLFGDSLTEEKDEISYDDYVKMLNLMNGMSDETPLKQIPEKV